MSRLNFLGCLLLSFVLISNGEEVQRADYHLRNGVDVQRDVNLGFPRPKFRTKTTGEVVAKVIFVDFRDSSAKRTTQEVFKMLEPSQDVFREVSYGKLDYKLEPHFKWMTMSKKSTEYDLMKKQRDFLEEAILLADRDVDFSQCDNVIVISNPGSKFSEAGPAFCCVRREMGIPVDGNIIMNGATSGHDLGVWKHLWLNHEISHTLGLVDLYADIRKDESKENKNNANRFVGDFSYMGFINGTSPGLLAWERLLLGWIQDDQIALASRGTTKVTLSPIEIPDGTKMVFIPIGETSAIVAESRRRIGLDKNMRKEGVLVYKIDTSLKSGFGPIQVLSKIAGEKDCQSAPLKSGEKISYGNVSIRVLGSLQMSDSIEVAVGDSK